MNEGYQLESTSYLAPRFALPHNIVMYANGSRIYFNAATPGTKSDYIPDQVTNLWAEGMCFIGEKDGVHVDFMNSTYCQEHISQ